MLELEPDSEISKAYIQKRFEIILEELVVLLPLEHWQIKPKALAYTKAKTAYGFAAIDGRVLINHAFLGTRAFQQLDHTIRHEFAHLAVGLEAQHNLHFRRMERKFGVNKQVSDDEEVAQLREHLKPKYTLFAQLITGEVVSLGGAHRRHKKYTQYRRRRFRLLTVDGVVVEHFYYQENSPSQRIDNCRFPCDA